MFRYDPQFLENEDKYAQIKASFFDSDDEGSEDGDADSDDDDGEGESDGADSNEDGTGDGRTQGANAKENQQTVIDHTETNLVHLRRTIYLMLQSSLSADEAGHRLLQLKIKPGDEYEIASMVLDCCAQTRSYESRYGRLAQRLCRVVLSGGGGGGYAGSAPKPANDLGPGSRYNNSGVLDKKSIREAESALVEQDAGMLRSYVHEFEKIFTEQYTVIHRLETAKLRNVALFYAHLLYTDSISWGVLECIHLNERDTTSSGRIFLKHLFLELCSFMSLGKLQTRLRDQTLQPFFAGILPRDNPKDTRFAINFFTTVGLGGLTLDLREHLQSSREAALAKEEAELEAAANALAVSEEESSSSSESEDSDSEAERESKKKRKKRMDKERKEHRKKKEKGSKRREKRSPELEKDTGNRSIANAVPDRHRPKSSHRPHRQHRQDDTPFFNDRANSPPARIRPSLNSRSH